MLFENNNYDYDLNMLNLSGFNANNLKKYYEKDKLYTVEEGFLRGNMWKNEYVPYKNMQVGSLNPSNDEESLKYKIMAYEFAINDLNLYLDLHPEDDFIFKKFKDCIEKVLKMQDEYSKKYGPLMLTYDTGNTYDWLKNPWPWDNDGGAYV